MPQRAVAVQPVTTSPLPIGSPTTASNAERRAVRNKIRDKFVDAAMARIADARPFKGKSKFYRRAYWQGERFDDIGIYGDGRLSNPHNYPEDKVRSALCHAGADHEIRRKEGAIQAVETRARRRSKLIYEIGAGILAGRQYGPRSSCCICKKHLTDPPSIERGIGPECWDHVLVAIEHAKDRAVADAAVTF
jgi:hypothetical protein